MVRDPESVRARVIHPSRSSFGIRTGSDQCVDDPRVSPLDGQGQRSPPFDKEKSRKQNAKRQKQKAKIKEDRQPKRKL